MKICKVTGKSSKVGGGYSNRTRATQFNPTGLKRKYANIQKKRTIQKNGAYSTLKKAGLI